MTQLLHPDDLARMTWQPGDVEFTQEHAVTAQPLNLAATATVDPAALQQPGIPVPDDTTAVPMFVAHRLDDTLRGLAHATERIRAAQGAAGDLRAYHCAHLTRHLAQTLDNLHGLTACINEHFPAEAAELEQVRRDVGLAKALSPQAKVATTAHLLETTLHETAHAERHAAVMGGTGGPDGLWAFNAEHCAKHLAGAVEHAKKLAQQFTDNYPPVARWLTELGTIASPSPGDDGGGRQHARYSGTAAAQLAGPVTVSGQVLELAASEAAAHAAAAQRLTWAEGEIEFGDGIGLAGGWKDAWRHELRGAHGEWVVLGATGHPVRDKGMAVVHPSYGVGEVTSISGARTLPKLPKEDPFLGPQFSPGWNAGARANGGQAVAHVTFADGEKKSFKYVDNADKLYAAVSPKPGAGLAHGADMTIPPAVQDTGGLYYAPHVPTTNGSLDDLSAAEKGSIYHYVSPRDNGVISAFLRKGGGGRVGAAAGEIEAKGTIAEIDSAEQKITLAEDTTVYRGIALTPALKKQIKPGATFTDKDYTSTSLSQDWADTFASLRSKGHAEGIGAHVKPVGGTPLRMALHLQAGQHLVPGEGDIGEYILPRGSSFHVNSVSGGQADITVTSPPVPAALAGSITEQLIELRGWEGWRDEPRDTHGQWTRGAAGVLEKVTEPIRGEGARGNSRPVSEDEFHQMAAEGRGRLNDIQHQPWTTEGIRKNWDAIKARTYAEVQNSWGGATIDPRSGHDLPQGADKYAMSVKPTGLDTTSIPEHASRAEFDEAMNIALAKYGKQLGKGGSYLGVFHDDDLNRIDIDPVTVLDTLREVETIGAYTHAIGGAYHFASGDGFWPPHVPEQAAAAMSNVGSGHHFRGPGHWHSQAVAVQQPHDEPEDTQPDEAGEDTELPPDGIAEQATDLAGGWRDAWSTELRGPHGEWTRFYHASPYVFKPGDVITPGHQEVSGTVGRAAVPDTDPPKVYFTDSAAGDKIFHSNIYEVEPLGNIAPDKHFPAAKGAPGMFPAYRAGETPQGMAYESEEPLRVVRVVTQSRAKGNHLRPVMGNYTGWGPDGTSPPPTARQFTTIGQQYLDLSWRDAWRTELRGPHGEWVRGGAITGQLQAHGTASAAARTGAADIPASGSYRSRLAADGLPTPSPGSLATARAMVASEGITAAQHEAVARVLGDNLDLIPPQMRDAMAKTHRVRVLPQKDLGKSGVMGETGAYSGSWEIHISKHVLTAKEDHDTADLENSGDFIKTEGDTKNLALRHTVTHEFGHGLFELAMIEAGKVYTVPGDPDAMATYGEQVAERNITMKIVEDLGGPTGGPAGMQKHPAQFEKAIHALSMYGSTSPPEAIAEAYTAYALSGKGADGSTLARTAGQDFLRAAEQEFASTDAGKGMTVNLSAADRPYTGCSGLPATTEDFERMYGTPEAKAAAARAWGLPAPALADGGISGQALGLAGGITAQVLEFVWEGWRTEPRDSHGRWTRGPGVLTGITAQAAAPARVPANQLRLPGMPRRAALHSPAPGILTGDPQALQDRVQRVTAARQLALAAGQAPARIADIGKAVAESKIYTATEMQRMQAQLDQLQAHLEQENLQRRRAASAVKIGIGVAGVVFSAMTAGLGLPIVAALAASSLAPVAAELADYHVGEKGRFSWLQHPVTKARTLLGHPVAKKTRPEPVPVAPPPPRRPPHRRSSPRPSPTTA